VVVSVRRSAFGALLLVLAVLLPVPASAATAADPAWRADYAGAELVRLINGERVDHGLPAVYADELLTDKARDGTIACPNDSHAVMAGRARDMVLNGVFSHDLRLCPAYTVLDDFAAWGYNTFRGEIIAWNNYPSAATSYAYGCSVSGADCSETAATLTSATVAAAMRGFMGSAEHRAIILGHYDRVGCGAWADPLSDRKMYACLFSLGGPEHRDLTAPTVSDLSGADRVISAPTTFSASFADTWRLSAGRVSLDGTTLAAWFFDHDVTTYRGAVTIDPAGLSPGSHTLTWQATDEANRHSAAAAGSLSFVVAQP
jgi:uncharacterized protein YkwD